MPMKNIISELKQAAGTQLDKDIVNILLQLIMEGAFTEEDQYDREYY